MGDLAVAPRGVGLARRQTGLWKALTALEAAEGGRDAMAEKLLLSSTDTTGAHEKLIELLASPDRAGDSLAALCKQAGLTVPALFTALNGGQQLLSAAAAQREMLTRLPAVAADVAEKGIDQVVTCPCTMGVGNLTRPPDPRCRRCDGEGSYFREASFDHQEMIFKATKLLPEKGGGVTVTQEQKVLNISGGGLFESFIKAADVMPPDYVEAVSIEDLTPDPS